VTISVDHLLGAKRFVAEVGGVALAHRAIEVLEAILDA
jgi:hypothetical protein